MSVLEPRGFDPAAARPVKATRAGRAPRGLDRRAARRDYRAGMNGHETHPDKKLPFDPEALRAKVRARLDAKAQERAARPPLSPAPRYDEVYFRGIEWLDSLSSTDDW